MLGLRIWLVRLALRLTHASLMLHSSSLLIINARHRFPASLLDIVARRCNLAVAQPLGR